MDIVERVARALYDEATRINDEYHLPQIPDFDGQRKTMWLRSARAAISEVLSALEEPSEAVIDASRRELEGWDKRFDSYKTIAWNAWQAMLSQVRKEIEG